jgi:hypothetical protein
MEKDSILKSDIITKGSIRIVCPKLACKWGVLESMILQQIYYWTREWRKKEKVNGEFWVYKTGAQWSEDFPFFSDSTIRRAVHNLKDNELIICGKNPSNPSDQTIWYRLHPSIFEKIEELTYDNIAEGAVQNDTPHGQNDTPHGQNDTPHGQNDTPHGQNDQMVIQRLQQRLLTEITTDKQTCARDVEGVDNFEPVDNFIFDRKSKGNEEFEQFWKLYPVKSSKQGGKKAFLDLKCYLRLPEVLKALESQILAKSEHERFGLFYPDFPYAQKWINKLRWEDGIPTSEDIQRKAKIAHRSKMGVRERANVLVSQGADQSSRELEAMAARNRLLALEENKKLLAIEENKEGV